MAKKTPGTALTVSVVDDYCSAERVKAILFSMHTNSQQGGYLC